MTTNEQQAASMVTSTITAAAANRLIAACVDSATRTGKSFAIAVCDPSGVQKAFLRMDGAPLLAVSVAQDKAYTAAGYGLSTDQWYDFIKSDPPLAMGMPHVPRLIVFGGGHPIRSNGELIGAIGVSGGHYTDDMACAREGLRACGFSVED